MKYRFALPSLIATLWLSWPAQALAHSVDKRFGDFYGGMLHPLSAIEHLFRLFALGLLAGQQGAKSARWTLLAFPLGLFSVPRSAPPWKPVP